MLSKHYFLILLLCFFVGCTNQPLNNTFKQTEYRYALVIANGNYPMQGWNVNEVKVDAEKLVKTLRMRNFNVIYVTDANLDHMQKSIEEFKKLVKTNKSNLKDTIALVYFVGHGTSSINEHSIIEDYLIPIVSLEDIQKVKSIKSLFFEVDEFGKLAQEFNNLEIKANIFILNAPRSNDLKQLEQDAAKLVLAKGAMEVAFDSKMLNMTLKESFSSKNKEEKKEYMEFFIPNTITISAKQGTTPAATGEYTITASLIRHLNTPNLTLAQITGGVVREINTFYKKEKEKNEMEIKQAYEKCRLEYSEEVCNQIGDIAASREDIGFIVSKNSLIDTSVNNLVFYPYSSQH